MLVTRDDIHLIVLVAQLTRRGLGSLIPHLVAGARYEIERGRLWVYLDADAPARPD